MDELFSADFFIANRARLRQLFTGTAPIILTANARLQRSRDDAYIFHQDRDFWYLTGITDPDVILVMDKGREYLITAEHDHIRETFEGALDPRVLTRISGIQDILPYKEGWKQLSGRIKKVKHVATLAAGPQLIEPWGMYANPARAELLRSLKNIHDQLEFLDLRPHLTRMRCIKQAVELEALQKAFDITIDTMREVLRPSRLLKYGYEYEIEAELTRGFRKRGAQDNAFTPIVAGGARACVIHNMDNQGALSSDELLTVDVGAEYAQYAADITRT